MKTMGRMRTINETIREIKQTDPNSAITAYFVRTLCNENKVRHIYSGTRVLVDYDSLIEYFTIPSE